MGVEGKYCGSRSNPAVTTYSMGLLAVKMTGREMRARPVFGSDLVSGFLAGADALSSELLVEQPVRLVPFVFENVVYRSVDDPARLAV